MRSRAAHKRPTPLAAIRLLVLDVDGVMTDGRLYYGGSGEIGKTFHVATVTASRHCSPPASRWR